MGEWGDFFLAEVGASAALVGLLFVAVSLNLAKILANPGLPNRAMLALVLLVVILVASSLMLIPTQTPFSIGVEILAIAAATWVFGTLVDIRSSRRSEQRYRSHFIVHLIQFEVSVIPYMVGGVILLTGGEHGIEWIAGAMIVSFTTAILDAWVLLIEINR